MQLERQPVDAPHDVGDLPPAVRFARGSQRIDPVHFPTVPEPPRAVIATVIVAVIGALGIAFVAAPIAFVAIALAMIVWAGVRRLAPAH